MRKLIRAKLRHEAKYHWNIKTIKAFRYLWKKKVVERRPKVTGTIRNTMQATPQKKKKSMLHRTINKVFGR